jgi:periplasmic protein TonB
MTAYVQDTQLFTRRSVVFVAIVALHVLIVWAIAAGLAHRAVEMMPPPIIADVTEQTEKKDEPPPPPPPQLERPPVEIPPPDVTIELPVEPQSTAIQDVTDKHVAAPPPPPPPVHHERTAASPGKGFPNTEDFYPPASQRLGESGGVNVRACVGANGRLTADPTIDKSSGSSRLDDGALRLAKAGSGKYKAATEDGKPVDSCFVFKVTFVLK